MAGWLQVSQVRNRTRAFFFYLQQLKRPGNLDRAVWLYAILAPLHMNKTTEAHDSTALIYSVCTYILAYKPIC